MRKVLVAGDRTSPGRNQSLPQKRTEEKRQAGLRFLRDERIIHFLEDGGNDEDEEAGY
jgi:hypothetical protein